MTERVSPPFSARRPAAGKTRPLSPSRPPHRFSTALLRRLDGVWVELTPDLARALAQKSMVGIATSIREGRERTAARAAAMAYRRQEQALLMEEREAERRNRALWRRVRVKVPKEVAPKRKPHRATRSGFLGGASPLPSYSGAIVDRLGRRNVFLRIRYYGRKTTRPGVGRRVAIYIYQGAVQNADGTMCLFSNVADTPEEAIAAMELIEQVNREASVDAKLLFHLIANLPHQLTVDQMMEEARRFAEAQFGSRDLPYVVALHPPSAEGDQRNWHVHILASTRPMRRVGNQEWELGEQLRTEIDNPEAFRRMRELYAVIQTEVAQEAGLDLVYTALSNAARGLPNKPQEHLGGSLTDLVRRGEVVAANERNHSTVVDGEQALLDERLRHDQEAAVQETALVMRAAAPFAKRAAAQEMASAVPGSVAISNLKHPPLTPAKQDRADHAATDVWPLATDTPASPSVLTAVADVPVLAIAEPSVDVLPTAAPNSQAVLRWDPALAGEAALLPVLKKASPLSRIMPASRSSIPPATAGSIAHVLVGSTTSAMAPLAPGMPASTLLATRSSGNAVGEPGLVPIADNAGRPLALSDLPPRQAPVVARLPDVPFAVPASKAIAGPALSRPPALQRSALTTEGVPRAIPTAADVSDAELNTIRRLIERARAEAKHRKAEREREAAALAAKREAEEASERADLERLKVLDPWVDEVRRKGLSVPDATLASLGRDRDWERTMPVQRALAAMLDDQNSRLDRMEHAADGTPPIAVVDGRPVPAAHLALDLARSIERWSDNPAFQAMAAALWPAPPPQTVSPAPVGGVLPAPAVVPPEDEVARSRRWAAAYRERLMVATDAAQRWDRNSGFIKSGQEQVEDEPPTPAPVKPATLAARHLLNLGRGR